MIPRPETTPTGSVKRIGCCLLAALVATAIAATRAPRDVRITLPDWISVARCTVYLEGKAVADRQGSTQAFTCPSVGETVRCDFSGAEPLDVALADVCRTGRLDLRRSRSRKVYSAARGTAVVEWLQVMPRGQVVALAKRVVTFEPTSTLQIGGSPTSFVRFSRPPASPVTVAASAFGGEAPFVLAPPRPGGEVFAVVERSPVMPVSYRLKGPVSTELARSQENAFSMPGLPQGSYSIAPVYEGGSVGRLISARITAGQTTTVPLLPEDVGAVVVDLSIDVCAASSQLRLDTSTTRSSRDGQRERSTATVARLAAPLACHMVLGGLAPGEYRLGSFEGSQLLAAKNVDVVRQAFSPVLLSRGAVQVVGEVRANGEALPDITVQFRPPTDPSVEGIKTTTDRDGRYAVILDQPGSYTAVLRRGKAPILGQGKTVTLTEGVNRCDWSINGGKLTIRLTGWDGRSPVQIFMSHRGGGGAGSALPAGGFLANMGDVFPLSVPALPYGSYRVWAKEAAQGSDRASAAVEATLSEEHDEATVDLDLREHRTTLDVQDEAGNPISSASVRATGSVDQVSPGRFLLKAVPAGTELHIAAAGFSPVCRLVLGEGQMLATLARGRLVELEFSRPIRGALPGAIVGMDNSDCPVPLSEMQALPVPGRDTTTARISIGDFPPYNGLEFVWRADGSRQALAPDRYGVIHITLPPSR